MTETTAPPIVVKMMFDRPMALHPERASTTRTFPQRIVDAMNPKLKPFLVALGLLAALLIVSQLVMGLLIVRGGGSLDLTKLSKAHQHSGYLTVTVSLIYIGVSLSAILSARNGSKP
jgi:hypothetical protein